MDDRRISTPIVLPGRPHGEDDRLRDREMAKGDEGLGIRDDDSATQRGPHPSLGESI